MDPAFVKRIRDDYATWSGGFPPEDEAHITVYVDHARPADTDSTQVRWILRDWMQEDANGTQDCPF